MCQHIINNKLPNMENKKLTSDELQTIKDFQKERDEIAFALGQIDIQRALVEGQRSEVLEGLAKLQEKNNVFAKELQTSYGDGNINVETGEFTPVEAESQDSPEVK